MTIDNDCDINLLSTSTPHANVSHKSESEVAMTIHSLTKTLSIAPSRREDFAEDTARDPQLAEESKNKVRDSGGTGLRQMMARNL